MLLHYPQQVIILKSLKRFEKLKIDYSKQYRIGLKKDTILATYRDKIVEKDSIIGRYQKQVWRQGKEKITDNNRILTLKKKVKRRTINFYTLLTLVVAGFTYERIH
jgi:hypothetical protein